ncbi:MAG: carbohydrate kinase [Lachnospiraceae bacterium]|jgi:sugar/nucleoside kinase (ribokinase family)|nr:carbohydrate kinase [Lachnospiraceae bacterium]
MKILCIGEMLIDFTPVKGMENSYTANPGGAPANVAVSAARNEIEAGFLGKLGNDDFGRLLVNTLKKDNVRILAPELSDEATTTLAFVTLDESGDRSFTFARKPGADMLLSEDDVAKVDFSEWDLVHAGSVSQSGLPERDAVLTALKKAKEFGKIVSFDINYRDKIWSFEDCKRESEKIFPLADLLKISDEELDFVGGEDNIPSFMSENDITVIVLTLGGDGARIYFRNNGKVQQANIPAMKVKVVDTTGAGDAYWGGFLSSLLRQRVKNTKDITMDILETAGKYGAVSGGLCVEKPGGIPALPTLKEIERAKA